MRFILLVYLVLLLDVSIIIVSIFFHVYLLSNGLCIISVSLLLPKPEDFKYMKIYVKPRSGWN